MFDLSLIFKILCTFGPWGLILITVVYMALKGRFEFTYPRQEKKSKRD